MSRATLSGALAGLLLAGPALADFPEPQIGHFSPADLLRAEEQSRQDPLPTGRWENQESMDIDRLMFSESSQAPADDDTAHYCRGTTLIVHVFIDHNGGTWSTTERDAAGAKSMAAKGLFLTNAPNAANVHFDNEGSAAYVWYSASLGVNIANDSMTWDLADDAVADIGFVDSDGDGSAVDNMTIYLQNWSGGWDNVILVFQAADITGRASASYGHAKAILYTDDNSNVWRHEWGHSFGACDEYSEDGACNGTINCGACQSTYLHAVQNNDNCQLVTCPLDQSCVMINNVSSICPATLEHWGWVDDDTNGDLDLVKRRDSAGSLWWIYSLRQDANWLWNSTSHGWQYSAMTNNWAVAGLRSPATADYDLTLYGDNNHNHQLASSLTGSVDFVVGDYNHSRLGDEFVQVSRFSGDTADYRINFDGNTSTTYPDGVVRNYSWGLPYAARALDLPLFGGETVTITVDIVTGNLDLGMALFRSSGASYYAGRSGTQFIRDAGGTGVTESWTYTVPADDVYGLILFSNDGNTGTYTVQVGPAPATLSEEVTFYSGFPLRLFDYDPNAASWSIVGNRPDDPGNTTVKLFNESTYVTELEESSTYNGASPNNIDFIAVDYNHVSGAVDYPRVVRVSGGNHRTEWEHDDDMLSGVVSDTWVSGHVGKIWDMFLTGGTNYFFRGYCSAADIGLYLYDSSDADYYKNRADFGNASNFRSAAEGGEWFNFTAPSTNWYGLAQIVNDSSAGSYSIWAGPDVAMADDGAQTRSDEVVFASAALAQSNWTVFGARPSASNQIHIWLYGDNAYTLNTLAVSDQSIAGGDVSYVVGDYNHIATGTVYPRFRRTAGSLAYTYEFEAQSGEDVVYTGTPVQGNFSWSAGDVVETIELWISGGLDAHIVVEDLSGNLDLGVELFDSNTQAGYYRERGQGVAFSDGAGIGGTETMDYTATGSDWHGLIVFNNNANSGTFRVSVGSGGVVDAPLAGTPNAFRFAAAPNPFRGNAEITFALPESDQVDLAVYDVGGRLVRQLVREDRPAGVHSVAWDGRDLSGRSVAAGVYLARIRTSGREEIRKITRVQ
jgi:hypothetical protein